MMSHRSRRDRGRHDRRPRGRHELRPDQDRRARAQRPRRQVQPAAAHRGGARPGRVVPRARRASRERGGWLTTARPFRTGAPGAAARVAKRAGHASHAESREPRVRRRPSMRLALFLVVLVGLLFVFVFPTRTFLDQRSETNKARAPARRSCRRRTRSWHGESKRLSTDAEIERLAREQYGLVQPGEQAVRDPARRPPRRPRRRARPRAAPDSGTVAATRRLRARWPLPPTSPRSPRGSGGRRRPSSRSSCATRDGDAGRDPQRAAHSTTARRCRPATGWSTPT